MNILNMVRRFRYLMSFCTDFRSQHQPVTMESDALPVQTPQMAGDINSGKCMLDQSNLSLQPASSIQKRIPAGSVRSHSSATLQVSSVDLDSSLQRKDVAFLHRQGVEQPSRNPSPLVELSSYDVKRVEEEVEEYPRDSSISIDTPTEYMKPHLSSIAVFDDPASPSAFVAGEKERTITKEYRVLRCFLQDCTYLLIYILFSILLRV